MKRIILLALALLTLTAWVSSRSLVLMDASGQTTTTTGTIFTFDSTAKPAPDSGLACRLTTDNNSGTSPTLNAKIQTCRTPLAADCEDLCVFTERTTETSGGQTIWLDKSAYGAFSYFRGISTLAGTNPNYDVKIELVYE